MSSMWMAKRARVVTAGAGLLSAWACTVADKSEYTFTDEPSAGHGGSGASGGTSGSAGAQSGGKSGAGAAGRGGKAGRGGAAGKGSGGVPGTGGAAGEAGEAGTGALGGTGGTGGNAGESSGGMAGMSGGEGGAGGEAGAPVVSCDPNPCLHGQCVTGTDRISCACDPGFQGPLCGVNIDDCKPNPCLNNGVCEDRINDFKCDCTGTGYSGTTCQTPAPCAMNPCLNGGVCTESGSTYTCNCTGTGFEGVNCETNHNDCSGRSCHENEGGKCTDLVNGYQCSYYSSCGKLYTAGLTSPGIYYVDPDGGDPSNAAERYCYQGSTLSGLGMGLYGASYSGSILFGVTDLTTYPGAFKQFYDKQRGVTNLAPSTNWNLGYCCLRDSVGPFSVNGSGYITPAVVNGSSSCNASYSGTSLFWLAQVGGATSAVGSVPLDPNFLTGWANTNSTCMSGTSASPALFWQITADP
jgi:hypothetical protein